MIRLSTNTIYERGIGSIQNQQADMVKLQQQLSTGRRILTPADDPVASARALDVMQADSLNTQFSENRQNAKSALEMTEGTLQGVTTLIQNIRTTALQAGNTALTGKDRQGLANVLRSNLDALVGLANSTDSTGEYLFSGYQGKTRPFAQTSTGVQYLGDQGQRMSQVSAVRQVPVSDSGGNIFEQIRNGNGTFVTAAATANTGSGIVDAGTVVTPASLTGHNYDITFTVTAGVTTYSVTDTTLSTTLTTGNPYTSGSQISFDGLQFNIQGKPASGDVFTVLPSTHQSVFTTLNDLINIVAGATGSSFNSTQLANGINTALLNLDNGLDNILGVRAAIGSHLQEIDSLQSLGDDLGVQYKQNLSQLQDVDYAQAISDFTRQQTYLQAAQDTFVKTTKLSLFSLL